MADSTSQGGRAISIARSYGALTRAITEQSNAERIRIAQANFDAERGQIEAQRAERSSELARVFQKHIGTVQANAAYRGVGGGSVAAIVGASSAEAEVARRNIDINANNAVGSAAAQAQVPIEDPVLAELQGTFQGLEIGTGFEEALARLEPETGTRTQWVRTGTGWQQVHTPYSHQQQFNLGELFPELEEFLREP